MHSVAQTIRPPKVYELAAKHAILYASPTDHVGQNGIALRDRRGRVFFQADKTGIWSDITAIARERIQLLGDGGLELAAQIEDGNVVVKCSRTLMKVAA